MKPRTWREQLAKLFALLPHGDTLGSMRWCEATHDAESAGEAVRVLPTIGDTFR